MLQSQEQNFVTYLCVFIEQNKVQLAKQHMNILNKTLDSDVEIIFDTC